MKNILWALATPLVTWFVFHLISVGRDHATENEFFTAIGVVSTDIAAQQVVNNRLETLMTSAQTIGLKPGVSRAVVEAVGKSLQLQAKVVEKMGLSVPNDVKEYLQGN